MRGQPGRIDNELRTRVVILPPLRLALLRYERGSVVAVQLNIAILLSFNFGELHRPTRIAILLTHPGGLVPPVPWGMRPALISAFLTVCVGTSLDQSRNPRIWFANRDAVIGNVNPEKQALASVR